MIVLTAPSSQIGRQVVEEMLAAKASVRLIARDPSKLPESVRQTVEVIEGSHGDSSVVSRAFDGAEAVFWLLPPNPTKTLEEAYLDFSRPAASAISARKVKRVVSVTALGRNTEWKDKAGHVTASIAMDDLLMQTGAAFRGLAMPSFMENTIRQAGPIKEKGLFFGPISPTKKLPLTATRDMATAAAHLLLDTTWAGQQEVPVLGPDDLSSNEMADIISDVLDREVRYQQIPLDTFKQQFLGRGMTESFAQGYVNMYRAKDEGMDDPAAHSNKLRSPTSFRQWCEQKLKPAVFG